MYQKSLLFDLTKNRCRDIFMQKVYCILTSKANVVKNLKKKTPPATSHISLLDVFFLNPTRLYYFTERKGLLLKESIHIEFFIIQCETF